MYYCVNVLAFFNMPLYHFAEIMEISRTFKRLLTVGADHIAPCGLDVYHAGRFSQDDFEEWFNVVYEENEKLDASECGLPIIGAYILAYLKHKVVPGEHVFSEQTGYVYLPFAYLPKFLVSRRAMAYIKHTKSLAVTSGLELSSDKVLWYESLDV